MQVRDINQIQCQKLFALFHVPNSTEEIPAVVNVFVGIFEYIACIFLCNCYGLSYLSTYIRSRSSESDIIKIKLRGEQLSAEHS